ncbi:MAG TPA: ribonuclease P protein component [Candidatus Paceibacterota bacterium]|nr:ribonuclease P protein component [Candidatus Paceibacterota bacterium]
MLPKKNKLPRAAFSELLAQNPISVFNRVGTLKYIPHSGSFSVVVSAKHCKRAVARNKVKRRVYSLIQVFKKEYTTPLSGILYLSKHAYMMPFSELKILVQELLRRAYANSK